MFSDLFRCPEAAIECAYQVHGVNKINVERMRVTALEAREFVEVLPVFEGSANGQLANLFSLVAATRQPKVKCGDAAAYDCCNGGAQNRGGGYVELHDWLSTRVKSTNRRSHDIFNSVEIV